MTTNRRRLALTSGMALSLMLTGAGIASAQTATDPSTTSPDSQIAAGPDMHGGFGDFDQGGRGPGGRGFGQGGPGFGDRGEGIVAQYRQLIRMETVVDLGEDGGIVTRRVEHGAVSAIADGSLTIVLSTGESVAVTTDADTQVISWSLDERPIRQAGTLADVVAGADVLVWSESQADGSFLASRVTIVPAADTTDTSTDGTTPEVTPEASPATVG